MYDEGGSSISAVLDNSTQYGGSGDYFTTINSGGLQYAGDVTGTIINSGGKQIVEYSAVASATVIHAGGLQLVDGSTFPASATAVDTVVSGTGGEVVMGSPLFDGGYGGITTGTTLVSGGFELLTAGATALDTTVSNGGILVALPGAIASGTGLSGGIVVSTGVIVYQPYQPIAILGASVSGLTVNTAATEYVVTGGTDSGTTLSGTQYVYAGGIDRGATIFGTQTVYSGGVSIGAAIGNGGTEYISTLGTASGSVVGSGGSLQVAYGSITGSIIDTGGSANIGYDGTADNSIINGGTEFVISSGDVTGAITFEGSGGVLEPSTSALSATISGFAPGDTIDLYTLNVTSTGSPISATIGAGNVLSATVYGQLWEYQLDTRQDFSQDTVSVSGTDITINAPCFRSGTRIATSRGEIAVEQLKIGDLVETLRGEESAIKWIGRRHVRCSRHPNPREVWPVRVSAGAFGHNLPHRALFLSPDHAVFVDDVLIPIRHLINDNGIEQTPLDEVTWFHVELARHDVLLAEGLPAESYLDTGDRSAFSNGGGPIARHPELSARMWEATGCARLVVHGPELDTVRRRLAERARTACRSVPLRNDVSGESAMAG